jgi:hypothetical protein
MRGRVVQHRDVTFEGSEEVFKRIQRIAEAAAMRQKQQVETKLLTAIHQLVVLQRAQKS